MTNKDLLEIGFKEVLTFTVGKSVVYDLGRNRQLSASCVGSLNEMLCICEIDSEDKHKVLDVVCLHNWDYDGELKIEKVKAIIDALKGCKGDE